MDKKEFATFSMALRTYYPREQILPNQEAMELWYQELRDIPFETATACLRKWVNLNKWSPSIADIREMCANIANGDPRTWQDGWDAALKAIRKFGYYDPKSALQYLEDVDPIAADCVLKLGYRNLCLSENDIADRAAFRGCYEIMAKREQERKQLALPLQEMLTKISSNSDGLARIGDGSNE